MAHVDDQRVARVLDALEAQHPGAQLLVNDPWSIYYELRPKSWTP